MTFRNYIVEAATEICAFNSKLSFARLGPEGLASNSTVEDIRNQAILVQEETREFEDARSVLEMLDGVVDMLVTEVWLDVLELAFHDNDKVYSIEEAIIKVLDNYQSKPLTLKCVEPMLMLARLGVDLHGATRAIIDDNNSKFTTVVDDTARSVNHYRNTLNVECEARPVDYFKRQWGIFRLPDLKMLKPQSYMTRKMEGYGLDLLQYLPANIRSAPTLTLDAIAGASTIYTFALRRDLNDYAE